MPGTSNDPIVLEILVMLICGRITLLQIVVSAPQTSEEIGRRRMTLDSGEHQVRLSPALATIADSTE